jgi:uncharacterized protein YjbI with pentapeptide repeats
MSDQKALSYLQDERFDLFNTYVQNQGGAVDLTGAHLRAYDLRKCYLKQANLEGAYLRSSDIRGVDLSEAKLDGASMKDAKVSGVMFPRDLPPEEIMMTLAHGTRIRHHKN